MKSFKPLLIVASVLVLLALAAPALAGGMPPCKLITQEEATAILGEPVKLPRSSRVVGMAEGIKCDYFTSAPLAKRGGVGTVKLVVFTKDTLKGGLFSSPKDYFERRLKTSKKSGDKIEKIAGLGQEAYWDGRGNRLNILTKDMYLQLSVSDLKQIKVKGGMDKLQKAVSMHRKKITVDAAKKYLIPKL
jgi:hypothetical protein